MRLVILGMHCSGTSSVAGLANAMGFYVGAPNALAGAADDEMGGPWERRDVVAINDALLAGEGATWVDPLPYHAGKASAQIGHRMDAVLADLDCHEPWMIEDPRLCVTLPDWAAKIGTPSIVLVRRSAVSVARSLACRNGLPLRYALALWEYYTVSALKALAPYPHYLFALGDLAADPIGTTDALYRWAKRQGCEGIHMPAWGEVEGLVRAGEIHRQADAAAWALLSPAQRALEGITDAGRGARLGAIETSDQSAALLREFGCLATLSSDVSALKREREALEAVKRALRQEQARLQGEERRLKGEERRLRSEQMRLEAEVRNLQAELQAVRSDFGAAIEVFDRALSPSAGGRIARLVGVVNRSFKRIRGRSDAATGLDPAARLRDPDKRYRGRRSSLGFVPRPRIPRDADQAPIPLPMRFPAVDEPQVSILVPVFNHYHTTLRCLEAILDHTQRMVPFEVIVADDCSSDATRHIEQVAENLRVYRQPRNLGFLKNCNRAAAAARGEYLLILNNDTRVQPGWLEALMEAMASNPDIGLVGPKFVFPDGVLQEAGGIVWQDGSAWNYGRDQDPDAPCFNYRREVDYISAACLLMRRALWQEIGGFDEIFVPAYYEDTDLAFKVRARGLKVVYVPHAEVVHLEGVSHGTDVSSGVKNSQERNRALFRDKWRSELDGFHFRNGESVFKARDRSRDRKTILVIDHYVPQYDRDAGSRSTWQYLELFVAQGHQVKFLGDNFCRHEPYTSQLQKLGVEVLYGDFYARNWKTWLREVAAFIDLVYLHRPHITEKYLGFLDALRPRPRLLYFGHDLHFLRAKRQREIEGDTANRSRAEDWRRRELAIVDTVDVAFYPSAVEVELLKRERPNAAIKRLPLNIWPQPPQVVPGFGEREGLLFVGGFGHPPNLDGILWFIREVWPLVHRALPAVVLQVVGSNMPDTLRAQGGDGIRVQGYLPDRELAALYRGVRVSVAPLRYGAGVKGKVLEALFHGVPVVTTPIGAEGIEGADAALRVCDGAPAFAAAVLECYLDEAHWSALSRAGRRLIEDHFSTAAVVRSIGEDFLFPNTGLDRH